MSGMREDFADDESTGCYSAKTRIREHLNAVQIGVNLYRKEMLAGEYRSAETTYARIVEYLGKISEDELLADTIIGEPKES